MVSVTKCLAIITYALNSNDNQDSHSRDVTTTTKSQTNGRLGYRRKRNKNLDKSGNGNKNLDKSGNGNENSGNNDSSGSGSYQGVGSFYYGTNGICYGLSYSENQGYTFCESDASGPNQLTLSQRNNLNIVAIGGLTRENKADLCGKKIRVYYNGVSQGQDYVIWDKCASCGDTTLDFSIDAIQKINPNACEDGLTKNVSWEILDTNGIKFVA